MRPLLAKDIAPFTKILAKMDLKESLKGILTGGGASELIWSIVENYHKAEKEFFAFLADLEGKTPADIADLPLDQFGALVAEVFNEKNLSFFKSVAK